MATKVNRDKWAVRSSIGVQAEDARTVISTPVKSRVELFHHVHHLCVMRLRTHDTTRATPRTNEYNWFT